MTWFWCLSQWKCAQFTVFSFCFSSSNSLDREINIHAPPSGYSLSISREPNKGFFGRRIKQFTVTDLVPGQGHTLQIIEGGVNSTFVLFTITSGHNKGVSVKVHLEYYDKAEDKQKLWCENCCKHFGSKNMIAWKKTCVTLIMSN